MTFKSLSAPAFSLFFIAISAGQASAQSPAASAPAPSPVLSVPRVDLSVGYQRVQYGLPERA